MFVQWSPVLALSVCVSGVWVYVCLFILVWATPLREGTYFPQIAEDTYGTPGPTEAERRVTMCEHLQEHRTIHSPPCGEMQKRNRQSLLCPLGPPKLQRHEVA